MDGPEDGSISDYLEYTHRRVNPLCSLLLFVYGNLQKIRSHKLSVWNYHHHLAHHHQADGFIHIPAHNLITPPQSSQRLAAKGGHMSRSHLHNFTSETLHLSRRIESSVRAVVNACKLASEKNPDNLHQTQRARLPERQGLLR
jgi:hypothetical protein